MKKFYSYILPMITIVFSLGLSTLLNNQFYFAVGVLVSILLLIGIAKKFNDKSLLILGYILLATYILLTILMLKYASEWSIG